MTKEKINFYLIIVSSLLLGALTDILFYGKEPGISFFIFVTVAIAFSLAIIKRSGQKINKAQILILASAIILSAEVFLKASSFLRFFNVIGVIYLLILAAILSAEKDFFGTRLLRYLTAPIIFVLKSFKRSASYLDGQKDLVTDKEKFGSKEFRAVLKGVIMALPLLAVLGLFLYSADMVVQAYVNKLLDLLYIKIDADIAFQAFIFFIVSYIFIGIFAQITGEKKLETPKEKNITKNSSGFIESATVLVLVELLFLSFIAIQFFYLFGGKSYVWGIDTYITYSEYARSGFSELVVVTIVSFLVIYAISESAKIETAKEKKIFKFLSAALFFEITIILLSAFKRISLYVDGYGMTFSRFLGFTLLLWIFLIFLIILYKIFMEKEKNFLISLIFAASVAVWIGINIMNPDAFIAKVNIGRAMQGEKLDPYYFSGLSDDAVEEIVKVFKTNASGEIKETIVMDLNRKYAYWDYNCDIMPYNNSGYFSTFGISQCKPVLFSEKIRNAGTKSPWQSYNLSKASALKILKENAGEIDKYQINYWKKAIAECKKSATQCETSCAKATWQANDDCKTTCGLSGCEEFEKNIKQY